MTDSQQSFERHPRFEPVADGSADVWAPTTNDWDATITVRDDVVELHVEVPMLDEVVETETVAPVVEDGWFETLERRLEDVDGVTYADVTDLDIERGGRQVTVEATLEPRPGKTAEDALAIVNYVEGTWFEGVIPGYEYVEKVQAMREQAAQNATGQDGERSGTPL